MGTDAPGPHHIADALAAAALARSVDVPTGAIRDGLRAHAPGDHRSRLIAEADGIRWVDDSKATNPHAAAAALDACDSTVWIAGGLLKGAAVEDLVTRAAPSLRAAILIGEDRDALRAALAQHAPQVPVAEVVDDDAVPSGPQREAAVARAAVQLAATHAQPGDTVLLAPAAASMDQFRDYRARGESFAAAVHAHVDPTLADG